VFFDHLGVEWQYEPQGFVWDSNSQIADSDNAYWNNEQLKIKGGMYLPDFWLPSIETWVEVKGAKCTKEETRTHFEFALVSGQRHMTAVGDIPHGTNYGPWSDDMILNGGCDFNYQWCVCLWCGKPGIEFEGRGGRVCGQQTSDDASEWELKARAGCDISKPYTDKGFTSKNQKILNAYEAARSARFEHGQAGAR
jgi:hypothetical protein